MLKKESTFNQKGIITPPLLVLIAVAGVLVFLLVTSLLPFKDALLSSIFPKKESSAAGIVDLGFSPTAISVEKDKTFSFNLVIDAKTEQPTALVMGLNYNPQFLQFISINRGPFFAKELIPAKVDNTLGTIGVTYGQDLGAYKTGQGVVATLSFKALKDTVPTTPFTIDQSKTQIAALNKTNDVLGSITNLVVTVAPSPLPTPTPSPSPSLLPSPSPSRTPSPSPSKTPLPTPTATPQPTATPKPTPTPTPTPVAGSIVKIFAAGTPSGGVYPSMQLKVDGQVVKTFTNIQGDPDARNFQQFDYISPFKLDISRVSISYINDAALVAFVDDRNLAIDKINIDGVDYQTEDVSTKYTSDVVWCTSGFKSSEWLYCNGTVVYRANEPTSRYLSDLPFVVNKNGWGPVEKDRSNGEKKAGDGRIITINGKTYSKGLGGHSFSEISYNLGGKCSRFKSDIGIDDETGGRGSVWFTVTVDGVKLYSSPKVLPRTGPFSIDVDVSGKQRLLLSITNGGDVDDWDHGDWALARVECTP